MDQEHRVIGLEQPAEVVVDTWGIPHIRARTRHDVFFVQGWQAGRDRLWQLDIWRKRGLGLLAGDFGPGFLAQDRASRLFLYRGDMAAEWAAYGVEDAEAICGAFADGINAWIALAEGEAGAEGDAGAEGEAGAGGDAGLLAPEFAATGTRPGRWEAGDVVRVRSHGRTRNVLSEVARAQVMAGAGAEIDLARRSIEPAWEVGVPEGVEPGSLPADVLDVFKLACNRVDFSPERMAATAGEAWRWDKVTDLGDVYAQGSNNWVVAGSRTESGRPVLASDPHREHSLPSLRSIVHLTGPGIDVIGAGEPALPGVSLGHNGHAAFGLTIFPMDQEDLYIYETHPEDSSKYRYGDGWEAMRVEREAVPVKGGAAEIVELKFTRHGPVVFEDVAGRRAYAVRTVWSDAGTSPYLASLGYLDARTPAAFAQALAHWGAPSVNQLYADADGHIAWYAAGAAPVRPNWDGLLPVPGDGRYEWAGFAPFSALPSSVDPQAGFFATANEMNLPDGYDIASHKLGFEWAEHSRADRIHQVLRTQGRHTLAQSMALQTDALSIPARRLGALLEGVVGEGDAAVGLGLLRGWDFRLTRESGAAAVQEVWWSKHLKPAVLDLLAPDPQVRKLLVPGDAETLLGLLEAGDARLGDRAALLVRTLGAAVAECRRRLGADVASWQWGRLHHGFFEHPLSGVVAGMRDVGPLAKGGSGSTPMAAGYRMSDFRMLTGASFRMVVDVGNWDNSRAINAPGQSGDPASAHYDDLAPVWAAGGYVPLLYSQAAVDAACEVRIRLLPAA